MEHNGRISYQTICAAKDGDGAAIEEIVRHYERYISHFSKRRLYDEYGTPREAVDEEIKQLIISELMYAVIYTYDHQRLPKGETLEQ